MSELRRRSDGRKLFVQRSLITRRIEVEALTRIKSGNMAIMIKKTRGEIPTIKSLRKQRTSKEASNLHTEFTMRTTMSYLTSRK